MKHFLCFHETISKIFHTIFDPIHKRNYVGVISRIPYLYTIVKKRSSTTITPTDYSYLNPTTVSGFAIPDLQYQQVGANFK